MCAGGMQRSLTNPGLRPIVLREVVNIGKGEEMKDIAELIKELGHKDISVRQNAAESLGKLGDESAIDALVLGLKDKNRFVRQDVITALRKIGGPKLAEILTHALKEEKDEFVKDSISKVLAQLQSKENVE